MRNFPSLLSYVVTTAFALLASPLSTAAPTTEALIAAMPQGTDSVLVCRFDKLLEPDSALKEATEKYLKYLQTWQDPQYPFHQAILNAVATAGLLAQAVGGSDFGKPPAEQAGIGVGCFKERYIFAVREPLNQFTRQLEAGKPFLSGATKHVVDGFSVYEGEIPSAHLYDEHGKPKRKSRFVALLDERILVSTETKQDAIYILKSLRGNRREIPHQWRELAAHVEVNSPIVILRRYDPKNENDLTSPMNPRLPVPQRVDIDGHGITLRSASDLRLQVYARTRDVDKAAMFLSQYVSIDVREWDMQRLEEGFVADGLLDIFKDHPGYIFMLMYVWFGQYIAM